MFLRSSNAQRIDITLGQSSKLYTIMSSLMKTWVGRDPQQMAQCVCRIPCECGRSYTLAVQLYEQRHNLKGVIWDEARIFEIENNSRYRKYKESVHMACLSHQPTQIEYHSYLDPSYQR
jgi:hypothetical protein